MAANLKISQLNDGTSAQGSDQIPVNRAGVNFRITVGYILTYIQTNIAIAISQVTGLVAALAAKSDIGHTHTEAEVAGLVADLAGKAALVHSHAESDVAGLVGDLAAKQDDIQYQDEGVNKGVAGALTTVNFVGAGVTASDSGTVLTVTIPGGGGGSVAFTQITANVPTPAFEYTVNVVDAAVSPTSKILLGWANAAQADANHPGMGQVGWNAVPGTGSFDLTLYSLDNSRLFGDFKLIYLVG